MCSLVFATVNIFLHELGLCRHLHSPSVHDIFTITLNKSKVLSTPPSH